MRAAAAVAMACVACGGKPPPGEAHPPAQQTPLDSPVTARATPPPRLAWRGGAFVADGLPAVARSGELAVVAVRDSDGARGFANLHVEVRDRTDKVAQTIAVMTVDEFEQLVPDHKTQTPELAHRLEIANHELAKLHGVHDLVAMHALEVQPTKDLPHLAIGDELEVDFSVDHMHVFHHNEDRPFITLGATAWLAKPGKRCPDCPPCENPALLAGAYHVVPIAVLVVDISYSGTDTCGEPPDQWHVVAW